MNHPALTFKFSSTLFVCLLAAAAALALWCDSGVLEKVEQYAGSCQ
jgi:hypothetical protein